MAKNNLKPTDLYNSINITVDGTTKTGRGWAET